jgi:predicted SprT family Zn-dependent metalloprotease
MDLDWQNANGKMKISKKSMQVLVKVNFDLFQMPAVSSIGPNQIGSDTSIENQLNTSLPSLSELYQMYDKINQTDFGGRLPPTRILYSERMLIAGSFSPMKNEIRIGKKYHEIFSDEIEDTLKHEMIHIINPSHNSKFKSMASKIGASLKAKTHPDLRGNYKYLYFCPACGTEYVRRKRLRMAYCGICSKGHGFDSRFKLKLLKLRK